MSGEARLTSSVVQGLHSTLTPPVVSSFVYYTLVYHYTLV